jgi:hypothetical protein
MTTTALTTASETSASVSEDRPEQDIHTGRGVHPAARRRVHGQEQRAEAEHPGEHAAHHRVVGAGPAAEHGHDDGEDDAGSVEADPQVRAERERGQRAGEGDVGQRVAGEHLSSQDDEVADQPGSERDPRTAEERVPEKRVPEHVGDAGDRVREADDHAVTAGDAARRVPDLVTRARPDAAST